MTQEIHVSLDLTIPRRTLMLGLASVLLLTAAPELGSESVSLSTYYPAPSGVYAQMITTNQTYMATQGGLNDRVGIGTTNPDARLAVQETTSGRAGLVIHGYMGSAAGDTWLPYTNGYNYIRGTTIMGDTQNNLGASPWGGWNEVIRFGNPSHAAITFPNGGLLFGLHSNTNFYWANTAGADADYTMMLSNTGALSMPHTANGHYGSINVGTPPGTHGGYVYIDAANLSGCSGAQYIDFGTAGGGNICAAGQYATFTQGIYVNGWSMAGHGGKVTSIIGSGLQAGQKATQVLTLSPGAQFSVTNSPGAYLPDTQWGTLNTPGSGFYYYCCPK